MAFFRYEPSDRWALLACDVCDRVLIPEGGMTSKRLRDSFPEDTAPFFRPPDELRMLAKQAGWRSTEDFAAPMWICPECYGVAGCA